MPVHIEGDVGSRHLYVGSSGFISNLIMIVNVFRLSIPHIANRESRILLVIISITLNITKNFLLEFESEAADSFLAFHFLVSFLLYNLDAPSGNLVGDIVILVSLLHVCNGLPLRTIVRINGILAMMILLQSRGDYNMLLWMIGSMVLLWCQGACFLVCVSNLGAYLLAVHSWPHALHRDIPLLASLEIPVISNPYLERMKLSRNSLIMLLTHSANSPRLRRLIMDNWKEGKDVTAEELMQIGFLQRKEDDVSRRSVASSFHEAVMKAQYTYYKEVDQIERFWHIQPDVVSKGDDEDSKPTGGRPDLLSSVKDRSRKLRSDLREGRESQTTQSSMSTSLSRMFRGMSETSNHANTGEAQDYNDDIYTSRNVIQQAFKFLDKYIAETRRVDIFATRPILAYMRPWNKYARMLTSWSTMLDVDLWLPSHMVLQKSSKANQDKKFVIRKVAWMQLLKSRILLMNRVPVMLYQILLACFQPVLVGMLLYGDKMHNSFWDVNLFYAGARSAVQLLLVGAWYLFACVQAGSLREMQSVPASTEAYVKACREPLGAQRTWAYFTLDFYQSMTASVYSDMDTSWFFLSGLDARDSDVAVKLLRATQVLHAAILGLSFIDCCFFASQGRVPPWIGLIVNVGSMFNMTTYRNRILLFVTIAETFGVCILYVLLAEFMPTVYEASTTSEVSNVACTLANCWVVGFIRITINALIRRNCYMLYLLFVNPHLLMIDALTPFDAPQLEGSTTSKSPSSSQCLTVVDDAML